MEERPQINTSVNLAKTRYIRIGPVVIDSSQILGIDGSNICAGSPETSFEILLKNRYVIEITLNTFIGEEESEIRKIVRTLIDSGYAYNNSFDIENFSEEDFLLSIMWRESFYKLNPNSFDYDEMNEEKIKEILRDLYIALVPIKERWRKHIEEIQSDLINNTLKESYSWEDLDTARLTSIK